MKTLFEPQVGLNTISLDEDPHTLSGGFKRRLALAIQLVSYPFVVGSSTSMSD